MWGSLLPDDEEAQVVDDRLLTGQEEGGRIELLDHRGTGDAVAGEEPGPVVHRARDEALLVGDVDAAASHPGRGRIRAAARQRRKLRRVGQPTGDRSHVDDLHRLVLGGEAVHLLVRREEPPVERRAVPVPPRLVGHGDQQLEVLAHVAQVEPALEAPPRGGDALAIEPLERVALELVEARGERGQGRGVERRQVRADGVRAQVLDEQAERAEQPRARRHRERADAQLARELAGVERPGAPERHQRQLGRVDPRCTVTRRTALAMLALTTRMIPRAVSSADR